MLYHVIRYIVRSCWPLTTETGLIILVSNRTRGSTTSASKVDKEFIGLQSSNLRRIMQNMPLNCFAAIWKHCGTEKLSKSLLKTFLKLTSC